MSFTFRFAKGFANFFKIIFFKIICEYYCGFVQNVLTKSCFWFKNQNNSIILKTMDRVSVDITKSIVWFIAQIVVNFAQSNK